MFELVPQELKDRPQWVMWRRALRAGKETKVPYQLNGNMAAVDRPETWTSFLAAEAELANGGGFDGIGFVLTTEDPYVGVDLDGDPMKSEDALITIFRLSSYMERSPSGQGVHIWVKGKLPPDDNPRRRRGPIEVYESGRYLTVTWNFIGPRPDIEELTEQLASVYDDFLRVRTRVAKGASTEQVERADSVESAVRDERAAVSERTVAGERADDAESTVHPERPDTMTDAELLAR